MRPPLNIALKMAIFESRKKQKRIAHLARIAETQLSHIVRGRRAATPNEQQRLATVLGKPVEVLFPAGPAQQAITPATETQDAA
jgi:plasmid maintenance system antidote protein VapI